MKTIKAIVRGRRVEAIVPDDIPDGTEVEITIQAKLQPLLGAELTGEERADAFTAFMEGIWARLEAAGHTFDAESALAGAQQVRREFDEQVEEAGCLQSECQRLRQELDSTEAR